jgi:phosphoribosylformylglycinamidine (FGAM) synthase PurS component
MIVQVLVRLAVSDPWCFTVLDTLKRKLGHEDVCAVHRMTSWVLDFAEGRTEDAVEVTRGIMSKTALLANPNRDRWIIRCEEDGVLPPDFWRRSPEAADAFVIEVMDKHDIVGSSMLRIINSRLRISQIDKVRHSTIWIVEFGQDHGAELVAREIAVAKSWRKGLLANPHCQCVEVRRLNACFGEKAKTL